VKRSVLLRLVMAGPWVAACAAGTVPSLSAAGWARPVTIGVFFLTAVIRTVVAALTRPTARGLPLTMAAGLSLFGIGSLVLALSPSLGFPSAAEAFFGAAYLCFTGYLILDTAGHGVWTLRAVLETVVIAGGIISATLFALVTPLPGQLPGDGVPPLLVYPLADAVLITIVLTQLITRRRPRDPRGALLLAGLSILAAVDVSLPLGLGGGGYAFTTLQDVVWAAALAMLAEAASRPARTTTSGVGAGIGSAVPVAAAMVALLVLAVDTDSALAWLTHPPAAATMMASLVLLLSSLRDARLATEAQRLSVTDDLTGLSNRRALLARLAVAQDDHLR
jgi:hypothetical protein